MPRNASPQRRGTKTLGGDDSEATQGNKPWWRGPVIAGGLFAVLLILAVVVNLTQGADSSNRPDGSTSHGRRSSAVPGNETGGAGGNAQTSVLKLVDGVPVGYPHSPAGAIQAAVNYQIARSSAKYFTDTPTRHKIIAAMATSEARDRLTDNDDTGMKQVLSSLGISDANADRLVARAAPMGTKTVSYTGQVATVEVWMAGLIGIASDEAPLPVSASWTTCTLTLEWERGDWKLASVTSVNGPTPVSTGSDPSSVHEFRTADQEFDAPPYIG
ncbi:hypothetical protein AB0K80_00205 [Streptomyces sp. NPDC052682]|uniref:hypothetical protein n=1 Tax=Streptomyces sp. NPDC052682 TaxID=3154954 RepID=UPI0034294316